jgi:hypothetical protein
MVYLVPGLLLEEEQIGELGKHPYGGHDLYNDFIFREHSHNPLPDSSCCPILIVSPSGKPSSTFILTYAGCGHSLQGRDATSSLGNRPIFFPIIFSILGFQSSKGRLPSVIHIGILDILSLHVTKRQILTSYNSCSFINKYLCHLAKGKILTYWTSWILPAKERHLCLQL